MYFLRIHAGANETCTRTDDSDHRIYFAITQPIINVCVNVSNIDEKIRSLVRLLTASVNTMWASSEMNLGLKTRLQFYAEYADYTLSVHRKQRKNPCVKVWSRVTHPSAPTSFLCGHFRSIMNGLPPLVPSYLLLLCSLTCIHVVSGNLVKGLILSFLSWNDS